MRRLVVDWADAWGSHIADKKRMRLKRQRRVIAAFSLLLNASRSAQAEKRRRSEPSTGKVRRTTKLSPAQQCWEFRSAGPKSQRDGRLRWFIMTISAELDDVSSLRDSGSSSTSPSASALG